MNFIRIFSNITDGHFQRTYVRTKENTFMNYDDKNSVCISSNLIQLLFFYDTKNTSRFSFLAFYYFTAFFFLFGTTTTTIRATTKCSNLSASSYINIYYNYLLYMYIYRYIRAFANPCVFVHLFSTLYENDDENVDSQFHYFNIEATTSETRQ